ncbi:tRNA-i(6)A37 thiotransferase enzyme MiaB [Tindallia magadiensis]|uniref:tRNA-2-methylthio-N(6)-dimethylallyladenosine synthase n=1 Tax=Tindallia magadiensis TaxID=69895 RepID=A0A1I3AFJ9_9FIRM|nr:tRNA (N6-isopentenyl adenosine(37)-C2)-methylthiotransferase MiaB [Tindallia magadiensis]SFH48857.1 tRNA-i(6)A37 thiotransferase enzyme MiaB [Tindallia magadiensis]
MNNNLNEQMYYNVQTFGCQMNFHDSEKLSAMLQSLGYIETEKKAEADIIIINTCCVRENAELKVYGNLGELKRMKQKNPNLFLAICGCMMQQKHVVEKIKKSYPFVDLVFGTHNLHRFPELLNNSYQMEGLLVEVWDKENDIPENLPIERKYLAKAFVNIMYGCNNFCSYCIVPYTRGRERSREPDKIYDEVKKLAQNGTLEITLLGQNVNSYGKTLQQSIDFSDLLKIINDIPGIERIRFMTSHPADFSEKLMDVIATLDKVSPHIHLPVQAGSNAILSKMNRKYSREEYLEKISLLKSKAPDIAISTDIIVGFPGETEKDFDDTLELVRQVEYDSAFTFLYSIRTGTPAATMENQVPDNIKMERFNRLVNLINEIGYKKNMHLVGKIVPVLVEGISKNNPNRLTGRTDTHKLVNFEGSPSCVGSIVPVRINEAKTFSLLGTSEL